MFLLLLLIVVFTYAQLARQVGIQGTVQRDSAEEEGGSRGDRPVDTLLRVRHLCSGPIQLFRRKWSSLLVVRASAARSQCCPTVPD